MTSLASVFVFTSSCLREKKYGIYEYKGGDVTSTRLTVRWHNTKIGMEKNIAFDCFQITFNDIIRVGNLH